MPLQNKSSSRKHTFRRTGYNRENIKAGGRQFDTEGEEQIGQREIGKSGLTDSVLHLARSCP